MKKILIVAGIAGAIILSLTGCGIKTGTITHKEYTDGYYQTTYICSSYASNGTCTIQVPIISWVDPTFCVDLKNETGDTGNQCTTQEEWNKLKVGDYVTFEKQK